MVAHTSTNTVKISAAVQWGNIMSEQIILTAGKLLNEKGDLCQAGYATSLVKEYNRKDIKASGWRIKEWDYYYIGNDECGVALTIADNSYMSLVSASYLDFVGKHYVTESEMKFFTFGKLNLPSTSAEGDLVYSTDRVKMSFCFEDGKRVLKCSFNRWGPKKQLFEVYAELTDEPRDSMVIATPFDKPKHFYYNQKINCMTAKCTFAIGGEQQTFDGHAVLDWGRGVWTYKNTWYWGSLNTTVDGRKVGFNIGYGFGNTDAASENMIFVDGICHKVDRLTFDIPVDEKGKDDFMSPWKIVSNDGKINLTFEPIIDRADNTDFGVLASKQHQVFGHFFGDLVFDDGSVITLTGQVGFAEKVANKW